MRWPVTIFLLCCVAAGVVAGVVWALVAKRPVYRLSEDLEATLGERELANLFASDALFVLLTAGLGLVIGIACWWLFHRNGWWVCLFAILGAGITGVIAWQVGLLVTPENFDERLASAVGGDEVPVDLQLHALAALLVGPFLAITPVMLLAAFAPEPRPAAAPDPVSPPETVL